MRATASPGISSTVSMTTKTTPSSTGTARSSRRATKVSTTTAPVLLVEPDLPQPEVVFDRVHREALDPGPRHHDLLGVVDRDPHHLAGQDVLRFTILLLALGLVQVAPRQLDQRVDLRVRVARGVPAGGRDLLAVEERVHRVVGVRVRGHPAEREHVVLESGGAELGEHGGPFEEL